MDKPFKTLSTGLPSNISEFKVCRKPCKQCLFSKNRIVTGAVAQDIIDDCLANDGWFECHKGTIRGDNICCRGFWDRYRNDVLPLRLVQMYLEFVQFVDPEGEQEK